jgi:hypothetical protein
LGHPTICEKLLSEIEIHGTRMAGIVTGFLGNGIGYPLMIANMFVNNFDVIFREAST